MHCETGHFLRTVEDVPVTIRCQALGPIQGQRRIASPTYSYLHRHLGSSENSSESMVTRDSPRRHIDSRMRFIGYMPLSLGIPGSGCVTRGLVHGVTCGRRERGCRFDVLNVTSTGPAWDGEIVLGDPVLLAAGAASGPSPDPPTSVFHDRSIDPPSSSWSRPACLVAGVFVSGLW